MSRVNKVSASLQPADAGTVINNIKAAQALLPFLINLSVADRKKQQKMGPKSVDYVNDCLTGAKTFENSLPRDFSVAEFEKDVTLVNMLNPLLVQCVALTEALQDTVTALGADCMAQASEVYDALKSASKRDANAKGLVEQIGRRYAGQSALRGKRTVVQQ